MDEKELELWEKEGVSPEDAKVWSHYGFTPKVAKKLIAAGFDGFAAQGLNTRGITSEEAEKWFDNGFDDRNKIEAWHDSGFGLEKAKEWYDQKFSIKDAKLWSKKFSPEDAGKWHEKDFGFWDAIEWSKSFTPEEAKMWVKGEYSLETAKDWTGKGVNFESAQEWVSNGIWGPNSMKEWQGMGFGLTDARKFCEEAKTTVIEVDEVKKFIEFKFSLLEAAKFTKVGLFPEQTFRWWSKGFTDIELIKKGNKLKKAIGGKCTLGLLRTLLPGWKHIPKKFSEKLGITLNANIINDLRNVIKDLRNNKVKPKINLKTANDSTIKEIFKNYTKYYKAHLNSEYIPGTSYKFKDPERESSKLDNSTIKANLERSAASMAYFLQVEYLDEETEG